MGMALPFPSLPQLQHWGFYRGTYKPKIFTPQTVNKRTSYIISPNLFLYPSFTHIFTFSFELEQSHFTSLRLEVDFIVPIKTYPPLLSHLFNYLWFFLRSFVSSHITPVNLGFFFLSILVPGATTSRRSSQ